MRPSRNYRKFHEKCCLQHFSWSQIWTKFDQIWSKLWSLTTIWAKWPKIDQSGQNWSKKKKNPIWIKIGQRTNPVDPFDQLIINWLLSGEGSREGAEPSFPGLAEPEFPSEIGNSDEVIQTSRIPFFGSTMGPLGPLGPNRTIRRACRRAPQAFTRALSPTGDWRTLSPAEVNRLPTQSRWKESSKVTPGHFSTPFAAKVSKFAAFAVNLPKFGRNWSRKSPRSNFLQIAGN